MRRLPLPALLGLSLCATVHADNGQLATLFPAEDIVIDGSLADWPEGMAVQPVAFDGNSELRPGDADFEAAYRAAFDPATNALYLALKVRDDTHYVSEEASDDWQGQDGVIVYLDPNHTTSGSGSALFSANGETRQMLTPEYTWDVRALELDWDDAEMVVKRAGDKTVYEARFQVPRDLSEPLSLGFDLLVIDHDGPDSGEGSTLVSWGAGFGKSQGGGRLGDLLLLPAGTPLGRIEGQVKVDEAAQPSDGDPLPPRRVRLVSADNPALWLQARADEANAFALDVPPGAWTVSLPDYAWGNPWSDDFKVFAPDPAATATVTAGGSTSVPPMAIGVAPRPAASSEPGMLFGWNAENVAGLEAYVAELMDYYRIPGISMALIDDGKVVYENTFGTKNATTGEPVTPETLFEAASITKIVFAFAVNRMAERGEIDLDKPLYEYLPFEELAYDERYKKITARHALSHQSGMPNWRWQNDDGQIDLKFYPGIQFGYSGEGYEYLGRVVAHLTGKPLEQVLMEEVQQPMGFTERTYFSDSDELRAVASRGHFSGFATPYDFAGEPGMAFSMVTEASVFSNFLISLLERKGLSEDGYAAMFEPQVAVPPDDEDDEEEWPARYGLGFHLMNSPVGLVFGHGGNNGDFVCMFEAYDEHDAGFIIFTNGNAGNGLINALREYLVVGTEPMAEVARVE